MPSDDGTYILLGLLGAVLDDVESARIGAENRVRALTHPEQNICLPPDHPIVKSAEQLAEKLAGIDNEAALAVKRAMRSTPLAGWAKEQVGLGEKQVGRLLAVIGHPCWRYDQDAEEWRERTIAQLWSYCGYSVVNGAAPRHKRGEQSAYNKQARVRAYLIAESCIKQSESPYRAVYDMGRAKYAEATHPVECKRCGPSGEPAQVGSPLSDGHKHARAMRLTAKAILKDLWLAASEGHPRIGPHTPDAPARPVRDRELVAA